MSSRNKTYNPNEGKEPTVHPGFIRIYDLRKEIADAAELLANHYPGLGGGALEAATSANCEELAKLVRPGSEHKWFTIMTETYCMWCGINSRDLIRIDTESFIHHLDAEEASAMIEELTCDLHRALTLTTGDWEPYESDLLAWKSTAEVMSDPELVADLLIPWDPAESVEITRP